MGGGIKPLLDCLIARVRIAAKVGIPIAAILAALIQERLVWTRVGHRKRIPRLSDRGCRCLPSTDGCVQPGILTQESLSFSKWEFVHRVCLENMRDVEVGIAIVRPWVEGVLVGLLPCAATPSRRVLP